MVIRGIVPMRLRDVDDRTNLITGDVIDAAIEVQRDLGSHLLEKPYELSLAHELRFRGHEVQNQVRASCHYKGIEVQPAYVMDLVVDAAVVIETKAVEALVAAHFSQLATYLRFSGFRVGLLINFHAFPLKTGIHRGVNPLEERP